MKTYRVTFREWMYQEKEIIVSADSKDQAIELARDEMFCPKLTENNLAEWYGSKFRELKPKTRIMRRAQS
jgi:hypothetical protein